MLGRRKRSFTINFRWSNFRETNWCL